MHQSQRKSAEELGLQIVKVDAMSRHETHRIYQNFVECLTSKPDISGLQSALSEVATAFDLRRFAYLFTPSQPDAATRLISNYPSAWTEHYLTNQYEQLDPVIVHAARSPVSFEWGLGLELTEPSGAHGKFFDEAAQFGIRYGFTIPIHDMTHRVAAMTFAADEREARFRRCVEAYSPALHLIAFFFHRYACLALAPDRTIDGISLSRREFECLEWASRGKSAWEIGQILGVSRRTAAFHLDNAKAKLGVRSISQAVALLSACRAAAR